MDKQAKLLQEYNRARMNEEAVNVERVHFYKTDRSINPKQEDPFYISLGKLPILVSAPHAVRYYRQRKIRMSDQFTGSIVYLLHQLTDCHAIAAAKLYGGDPNTDNPCIYKNRIAEICARQKVKLVLDIHGAAREREFDADFGTNGGKTVIHKTRIIEILTRNFLDFGLSRVTNDHVGIIGANAVTAYVARELGIPVVQIEINKQYRVPGQNPHGFHRLLAALVQSIKELAQ